MSYGDKRPVPSAPPRPPSPDDENNYEIVRVVSKLAPANYLVKIGSFSSIVESFGRSRAGKIELTEFTVGGHKWAFSVYPCGNKKEKGDGHLSFYVRLCDSLRPGLVVYASYRFFVYDQIHDNYLTIQDLIERRFHASKTEWGMPKALELSIFRDSSNGFLINDCCVFGVEVVVIDKATSVTSIVSNYKRPNQVYAWRVANFSYNLRYARYSLPVFYVEGLPWRLHMSVYKGHTLSLFLQLCNHTYRSASQSKLYVAFQLCIQNQSGGKHHTFTFTEPVCFTASQRSWGKLDFMPLKDINDTSEGFKVNDQVVVEVCIHEFFIVEASVPKHRFLRKMFCFSQ